MSAEVPLYYKYWGKARKREDGGYDYHLLPYHCLDVAAVGRNLLAPETQRNKDISFQTGLAPETIQYLFTINMLLHDLGKFSVCFQSLIEDLLKELFPDRTKREYHERHDTLGFILWREEIKNFVIEKYHLLANYLDVIIKTGCGHHGLPPKESAQGGNAILRAQTFFDNDDIRASKEYVFNVVNMLGELPSLSLIDKNGKQKFKYVSWQFAGLGIIADWVGSNADIFTYPLDEVLSLSDYWCKFALPRAEVAVKEIEWKEKTVRVFTGIKDLFPFIKHPSPLQKYVSEVEFKPGPKLWIIEDVTGTGKTEAALLLAQRMMAAGDADGLYIGLPTMATANAMYARLKKAYESLYKDSERPSLVLSHGRRDLSEKFKDTIGLAKDKSQILNKSYGEEENSGYCNRWIADNRKKALLADVGVGTIDQALLGVLPARHQSLRLAGLHRKVLIVDEVHAYDPYVEHLLCVLLEAHARNGGSVILLSATIPLHIREKLVMSFQTGLDIAITEEIEQYNAFPLVTQVSADGTNVWSQSDEGMQIKQKKMRIDFIHDADAVYEKIFEVYKTGDCVCWIRNTVNDARKSFFKLVNQGIPYDKIDLFHSRFAMIDRARIENAALHNFGKESGPEERSGRILIATQVVEQSLDLDFDYMVSDLAPIDLLIQRAGRVYRHIRDKYGNVKQMNDAGDERLEPVLTIFAPTFTTNPDTQWLGGVFSGTAAVYKHHGWLWLTQKKLAKNKEWSLPQDARTLIEDVYSENAALKIPDGLQNAVNSAQGHIQAQEGMGYLNALILKNGYCRNAVRVDQWNEEEKVQTRLSDENVEIALTVYRNGRLLPYAKCSGNAWDWSTLSISQKAWNRLGYLLPEKCATAVEEIKERIPRLKCSKFVIVTEQSDSALSSGQEISEYYSPHNGWGASLIEEE